METLAASLMKISNDIRWLGSGPRCGLGELRLPARQAGSSIMPGKVNPVIPEAASQVAMLVMGHDATIATACAAGSLELNPFLPLVAACLLDMYDGSLRYETREGGGASFVVEMPPARFTRGEPQDWPMGGDAW